MAEKVGSKGLAIGGGLIGAFLGAASAWMLYSKFGINHSLPLPEAIPAPRKLFEPAGLGKMSYSMAREAEGKPLVLLHSINAAASTYEMQPLFHEFRSLRPVYALDWPGFGFSERPERIYSAQFYQDVLTEFLEKVVQEPADVVALSLGGEFAARAALARPDLFHSLVILSPTGMSTKALLPQPQQAPALGLSNMLHPVLSFPMWGRPLFDFIAMRTSIEFFLRKSFTAYIPPGMVEYAYTTAHQPGAEYAPLFFLAGKLFTPQVCRRVYVPLRVPALAIYDHDPYSSFDALPELLLKNYRWQAVRLVPSRGMPHWERLADTREVLEAFWKSIK